jgi:hypothetical protein
MGLTVEYGYLFRRRDDHEAVEWFGRDLAAVNAILGAEGLPDHVEPTDLGPHMYRCALDSIAWSWLHCLRRLHALALQHAHDPDWRPDPAADDFPGRETDPAIAEELWSSRSHLIVHSDDTGWYVPIDFRYPLYSNDTDKVPGDILGSSVRLLDELRSIAPWLGIVLDRDGELDDAAVAALNVVDDNAPWWREKYAWFHLFEPTRLSVDLGTAVVFT